MRGGDKKHITKISRSRPSAGLSVLRLSFSQRLRLFSWLHFKPLRQILAQVPKPREILYVVSNSPVKRTVKPPRENTRSGRPDYVKPTLLSSIRSIESISEMFERKRASGNESCFR